MNSEAQIARPSAALLARTAVGIALFGVALAALTTAEPILAIVLAWPFLVVVPGWLLVARVVPDLGLPGRLGVGLVANVYVAAHLANLLATAVGFGRPALVLAAWLLAIAAAVLALVPIPHLANPPRPDWVAIRQSVAEGRGAWILASSIALIVLAVLGLSAWHDTPAGWVSGGWNWSDFLVHVSIGQSIIHGNFPPQVPYFAGEPLIYHWFADFHGAILAALAGIDVIPVFVVSSAAMAGALALVVWELAHRLTLDRRAAAVAVVLVCFGGGMGWLRLVLDLLNGQGDAWTLIGANPYDNSWASDWPWFRIASVLGTGLLPHRATTFGLPGFVAALVLLNASMGRRPAGVLLGGLIAALLAPFQFFAFPATYLVAGLFVAFTGAWRRRTFARDAVLFLAPAVLALPFIVDAIALQRGEGAFRIVAGWSEARFADGPLAVAFFYATNLGLPAALAVVAAFDRTLNRQVRGFLAAWAVCLFVLPNVIVVSAVAFDMNKYFQLMWIAVAILAAWLVHRWPRPLVILFLLVAGISPALVAIWTVRDDSVALSNDQEQAARWIEGSTPDRSIFVTDAFINSPVDLAGRLRISGFGPYVSNLGYSPEPRQRDIHSVYCDGDQAARQIMARYRATFVLSTGGLLDCGGHDPTDFDDSPLFEAVFRSGSVAVWHLRG